jgi:dephospho-CoA kinase
MSAGHTSAPSKGKKYVIGLTGNIATGKSIVLRMLKELGAYTVDADDLAHILMRRGAPLHDKIVTEFGRYVLDEDGEIDRSKLGEIVFASPRALTHLESITHPTVNAVARRLIAKSKTGIVAIEAIKLIESGMAKDCDAVWVVTAGLDTQMQRPMSKRRLTGPQAMLRIDAQPPQEATVARATVVIDNSGDILATFRTVQRHFAAIARAVGPSAEAARAESARRPVAVVEEVPAEVLKKMEVRRARRGDLAAMAAALASSARGGHALDQAQMMERFFTKGYFLALAGGHLLGLAGLHTENLIATIDDFVVRSTALWPAVGKALLDAVEADMRQLSCEVALLFARPESGSAAASLFEKSGYRKEQPSNLIKMWREAAEAYNGEGNTLFVKQMLERQILKPI